MRLTTLQTGGGAYVDDTRPYDQQDCINYIPEASQDPQSRAPSIQRGAPGLLKKADVGSTSAAPCRGLHNVEGTLFGVFGQTLYQINPDYTTITCGTVDGYSRVSMQHNQIADGYQLLVVNGQQGYVWNTTDSSYTVISSDGWHGGFLCDYMDSYLLVLEPFGRFFYWSALADALTYPTTNRIDAEGAPDPIIAMVADHQQVWCFGTRSIQVFYDTGDAVNGVFQNQPGVFIEVGCAGRYTVAKMANTLMWLGNDGILYRFDGYTPIPVSTHAFEQAITNLDWANAYAFAWTDRGHAVYYITFPDGQTFGYDLTTGLFHRRQSYGLDRWRVSDLVYWQGKWMAGDIIDNRLYQLDWHTYVEDTTPLVAERTFPYLQDGPNRFLVHEVQFLFDTGHGATPDAYVNLCYSDDNGNNYANWKQRSMGKVGMFGTRVRFHQLGSSRGRIFRVQISSPVKRDLIAGYANLGGTQ